jgi:heparanase 1
VDAEIVTSFATSAGTRNAAGVWTPDQARQFLAYTKSTGGSDPWASTFLDSFRYLDQLGRMSKRGVQANIHKTLASSDYGLLDENTMAPRPDYWAALLWRKFMGTTVLDPGASPTPSLHLYAHCLRGQPGGVALLAINTDQAASHWFDLTTAAERYTLSTPSLKNLEDTHVQLNGTELKLGTDDGLPPLTGVPTGSGHITFAPATISFVAIPLANNASCR